MISKRNFFKLALLVTLIAISYLVFSRPNYSYMFPQAIPNMDKIGHFGSFFCLAYLTHFAFKPKWYQLAIMLACYGIFIELVQSTLPYRSASVADFVADMLGVLLFSCCHWSYQRYIKASRISES